MPLDRQYNPGKPGEPQRSTGENQINTRKMLWATSAEKTEVIQYLVSFAKKNFLFHCRDL
jgi:hypothetical protein